ncbi:GspH/FimT family pseudopilin [Thalassotalea sediminis]|uniref:GspH/FimT family pseudopilin n=1 Tax=Thalassotalea sediminis TaxID=1759089 RepID=UPI00257269FE|nr:GspH/FimT family pseudopilin [Thalassotalea sediminis]
MNYLAKHFTLKKRNYGFTMIELLVTITILGIASMIAVPALSEFLVKSRTDNEVIELQRFILTARNAAINSGQQVTICPLNAGTCSNDWDKTISMFMNEDDATKYNAANETMVKVKDAISSGDKLAFSDGNTLIYSPTGRLVNGQNVTFTYCPKNHASIARGVSISLSGRVYITQDTDNDNKDEDRLGNELNC